jgi:aminoglycoside phosphotransferase
VCHGDYCLPNVLIAEGEISGFVDLGELGVADRWSDLATALWSVGHNLGRGWRDAFLDAYGVEPNAGKIALYSLPRDPD